MSQRGLPLLSQNEGKLQLESDITGEMMYIL
jgi:hypothetical protein